MMNVTEDFYLPVRGRDSGTEIETMQGLQFNAIEDIEYLRKKLLAAFKVPKSFIGYEEDINGKATLAAQDVRFARTVERIQRIMVSELTKIAIIHLYVQGFTDDDLVNFEIALTNPSTLYEQEKINLWQQKFQLAQQMTGGQTQILSQDWVYKHILEMSEEEVEKEREKIIEDLKRQQEQQNAAQPPEPQPAYPEDAQPELGPEPEMGDDSTSVMRSVIDKLNPKMDEVENEGLMGGLTGAGIGLAVGKTPSAGVMGYKLGSDVQDAFSDVGNDSDESDDSDDDDLKEYSNTPLDATEVPSFSKDAMVDKSRHNQDPAGHPQKGKRMNGTMPRAHVDDMYENLMRAYRNFVSETSK
jgi:hypothetical protein